MKTTHKNFTQADKPTGFTFPLFEKLEKILNPLTTLNSQTKSFKTVATGVGQTREDYARKIDSEIRRNQAVSYLTTIPPR